MRDLKEAFRALLSTPGPTVVIVMTLALAIGANTAIFSVVSGVLLRPLGYGNESDLVVLWESNAQQNIEKSETSTGNYRDWRQQTRSFDGEMALYRYRGFTMTALDRPSRVNSLQVSPRLFRVLGVDASAGRTLLDADEAPGNEHLVVLTHEAWTRRFGADPDLVGTTLELDSEPYLVVGVTDPGFVFPPGDPSVEMYSPLTIAEANPMDRPHRQYLAVANLGGTPLAQAQEEIDAVAARIATAFPDSNEGWGVTIVPLREEVVGDISSTLWLLLAAVFVVLLIACANVGNLLIARSTEAARSFTIRSALGASRLALVRRSLADSVLLAAIGGAAGVLLSFWGVALLRTVIPASVPRAQEIGVDPPVLMFAAGLSLFASLAFGLLPALRVMKPNLADALRSGAGAGGRSRSRWLTQSLVVAEVALALLLMVGAALMVRSFARLSATDPGYRTDDIVAVAIQLPASRYGGFGDANKAFFHDLTERVQGLPGVTHAGAVSDLPMSEVGVAFEMPFTITGLNVASPTERPRAQYRGVIPGYLEAMGIPLLRGRLFDRLDGEEAREIAIVNQALVDRYLSDREPIGEMLVMPMAGQLEIVGVVDNTLHGGLQSEVGPELYVPYAQIPVSDMHVVVRSEMQTSEVAAAVGRVLLDMDPELAPTQVVHLRDALWESIAQPRFNTALLGGLALCAAVLAAVGIFGVVSYSVVQRTSEIGVRMALGAGGRDTVAMVVRQAMLVVAVGAALGIVLALASARFIERLLHGIESTDPMTYVAVTVLALGVGMLASLLPALRATRVDPVVALREER